MHILIPVFFKAAHGGLHQNILASARHLISRGHDATVVCPPGPFSDSLKQYGIGVIRTDYTDHDNLLQSVQDLHKRSPISLVHAHPFASRKFGLIVAERLNLPFLLTMHGKYTDGLSSYESRVSTVLTVSAGIRDYLVQESQVSPERIVTIPNVPDQKLFSPWRSSDGVQADVPDTKTRISLVSRLDQDKQFILDVFIDAVEYGSRQSPGLIEWVVVGDGTQSEKFKLRLDEVRGDNSVSFVGWLEGDDLRDAYRSSSCVIAPGRCALEAMACAVPVIAVGSKGYVGLICENNWQSGVYANFGGVGSRHEDYQPERIQKDLDRVLVSGSYRQKLGYFSNQLVRLFFNEQHVHDQLLDVYHLSVASHRLNDHGDVALFLSDDRSNMQNEKDSPTLSPDDFRRVEQSLLKATNDAVSKNTRDLLIVQNRLYAQLEKLNWLTRSVRLNYSLPALRGWAASPDVLLMLHEHVRQRRPRLVVEFGSGCSTVVIADALRQNGFGKLVSFEHSSDYAAQTLGYLERENLDAWVDLRLNDLTVWDKDHLATSASSGAAESTDTPSLRWYDASHMTDLEGIDLMFVDGPPGGTCPYSRYPALPALADRLSSNAEVWMDDTIRQEEKDICADWAQKHGMVVDFIDFEKGMGRLKRDMSRVQPR